MATMTSATAPHFGPLRGLVRTFAGIAACAAVIVAVAAGTGWLYLLRHVHGLAAGPRLRGALPLQQLAGGDAQPLARMVVAWLPTGLALGLSLTALTRLPRFGRTVVATLGAAVLLVASATVSDAVAQNERVQAHLSGALSLGGVWMAVALLALGVAAAP
jgi:hypothetical protein